MDLTRQYLQQQVAACEHWLAIRRKELDLAREALAEAERRLAEAKAKAEAGTM